jgi:hypothetical protein
VTFRGPGGGARRAPDRAPGGAGLDPDVLAAVLFDLDAAERGTGRPDLAVLVVRQSDGLPGQGWWLGQSDYKGLFVGFEAATHVAKVQQAVFAFWAKPSPP